MTIEQIRRTIGLSRPQMLAAIGARPGAMSLLATTTNPDAPLVINPLYQQRAQELLIAYEEWKQSTIAHVAARRHLSLAAFAVLIDVDRYALYQAVQRGRLAAPPRTGRQARIAAADVERMFAENEQAVANGEVRGALADSLLRYLGYHYQAQGRRHTPHQWAGHRLRLGPPPPLPISA